MSNTPTMERPPAFPNKTTFGPGSLESITLVSWVSNHQRWVRVKGTYTVYCGLGHAHRVEVDARHELAYVGFTDPGDVAHWLIGLALEDEACEDCIEAAEDATWD